MEISAWKTVLLEWATCTGFLDQQYTTLNQTNIESFYRQFKNHMTSIIDLKHTKNVFDFIQKYYLDFEINRDSHCIDKTIDDTDYVYVYTLLLHFSCLRYPEKILQNLLCKHLKGDTQQFITRFLIDINAESILNRQTLCASFSSAVGLPLSPTSATTSPSKFIAEQKCTPPTPKTKLLDDWNVENKSLKAQLETERFEKGYLENQLIDCEQQIKHLITENRRILDEIHQLKNERLSIDTENISPNKNDQEYLSKRRLIKQIEEKDEIIIQQKISLNAENDQKIALQQRLNEHQRHLTEVQKENLLLKQYKKQFTIDLEEKTKEMDNLRETIKELNDIINDSRAKFDESVEYVGSHGNVSSDSNGSPPNLTEIIDMQLQHQKKLNRDLTEKITTLNIQLEIQNDHQQRELLQKQKDAEDTLLKERQIFETKLSELNQKLDKTVADSVKMKSEMENQIQMVNEFLKQSKDNVNEHTLKVKQLNLAYEKLNGEKSILHKDIANFETLLKTANDNENLLKQKLMDMEMSRNQLANELSDMKKDLKNSQNEFNDLTNAYQDVLRTVQSVTSEKDHLKAELEIISNENNSLKQRHNVLETIEDNYHQLQNEYSQLENDSKTKESFNTKETTSLHNQIEEYRLKNERIQSEVIQLRSDFQSVFNRKEDLSMKLQQLTKEKKISDESTAITLLQRNETIASLNNVIEQKRIEVNLLNDQQKLLSDEIIQLKSNGKDNEKIAMEQNQKLNVIDNERKNLQAKLDHENELNQEMKHENSRLNDAIKKNAIDLQAKIANIVEVTQKLQSAEDQLQKERKNWENNREKLQNDINRLNDYISDKQKIIDIKESDINRLSKEINEKTIQFDEINCKHTELSNEHSQLKWNENNLRQQVEKLQNSISDLETKSKQIENDRNDLQVKLSGTEKDIESKHEQILKQCKKLDQQDVDLQEKCAIIDDLRKKCESQYRQMTKEQNDFDDEREKFENHIKQLKIELSETQNKLYVNQDSIETLTAEIKIKQNEIEQFKSNNDELNQQISQIKIEQNRLENEKQHYRNEFEKTQSNLNEQLMEFHTLKKNLAKRDSDYEQVCNEHKLRSNEWSEEKKKFESMKIVMCEEYEKQILQKQNHVETLNSQLLCKSEELDLSKRNLLQTEFDCKKLTEQFEDKCKKLREVENQIKDIQDGHKKESASLSSRLIEMKSKYEREVEEKLAIERRLNNDISIVREEKSRLEGELALCNTTVDELTTKLNETEKSFESIISHANHKIEQLSIAVDEIQKQFVDAQQTIDDNQITFATLRNENQCLTTDKIALLAEIDLLQTQINSTDAQIKTLKHDSSDLSMKFQDLTHFFDQKDSELSATNEKLTKINRENTELRERIDCDAINICRLEEIISHANEKHLAHETERKSIQKQVDEMTELKLCQSVKIAELESLSATQEKSIKELKESLSNKYKVNIKLEETVNELKDKLENINETLSNANKCNAAMNKENERLTEIVAEQKLSLQNEHETVSALQQELIDSKQFCEKLENLDNQQKTIIEEFEKKLQEINEKNSSLELELSNAIDSSTKLKEINETNTQTYREQIEAIEQLESNNESLTKTVAEQKLSLQNEQETLSTLKQELIDSKQICEKLENVDNQQKTIIEEFEKKFKEINEKNSSLELELSNANDSSIKLKEKNETNTQTYREQIAAIEQKRSELESENESLAKTVAEQKLSLQNEQETLSTLKQELIDSKQICEKLENVDNQQKKIIEEFEKKFKEINEKNASLELELTNANDSSIKLKEINETNTQTYREQIDAIEQQRSELESRAKLLTENVSNVTEQLEELRKDHQSVVKINSQLTDELAKVNKINDDLTKENVTTRNELSKSVSILHAKLIKNREMSEKKEEEWKIEREKLSAANADTDERIKEVRFEMEGKLEKMKAKMKTLYNEEFAKLKQKHEQEIYEYKSEEQKHKVKIDQYEQHVQKLSHQIYQLNENQLDLKKSNEYMKNQIRYMENNPRSSKQQLSVAAAVTSNFKMEDEEAELFNNDFLNDLKAGINQTSPTGRNSVRFSELKYRNSLLPHHLRSTYAAQYGDQNYTEDDLKIERPLSDESITSTKSSEIRRGTLYKRPGPPTPSKNGGRLSFGGTELPRGDILKESNNNREIFSDSIVNRKMTPNKTGRQFRSIFSSKGKDEKTNGPTFNTRRTSILKLNPKIGLLTSTPRRCTQKRKSTNCSRNLLKTISNQPINDDLSFNINERISNIAFLCADNESIVSPKKSIIVANNNNNNNFITTNQESCKKLCHDETQKKSLQQRDRRQSILLTKRRKSMKIGGRSLRDQARAKAKRQRDDIYNTGRPNFNKKSSSNDDDDNESDDCNSNINENQKLIDQMIGSNNNNVPLSTCDKIKEFENLLQIKQCEMPYNETPILPSSINYRSSSIDCLSTINDNSSKTIYPNISGNRKIPYLRFSNKSFSRQTLGITTISNIPYVDSCIDRPRIRLIDLCSWQQLDRSIQSIIVFFICGFILNVYQIIMK